MGDGRSVPRVGVIFTDPADLRLLVGILERACDLDAEQHERRMALRRRMSEAAQTLDRKLRRSSSSPAAAG